MSFYKSVEDNLLECIMKAKLYAWLMAICGVSAAVTAEYHFPAAIVLLVVVVFALVQALKHCE